jgi:Fe-S oxidoreductase
VTLQAEARLVKSPQARVLVVAGFADIYSAADAVPAVLAAGPIACEGLDQRIIGGLRERNLRLDDIALLPPGDAWLMVEFGGDTEAEALERAKAVPGNLILDKKLMNRLWTIRETGASATALNLNGVRPDPVVGWEDAAVDPYRLGAYLREFQALIDRCGYTTSLYGHFGDGCVHARINFDLRTPQGLKVWRGFLEDASHLVVKYGGSLSGEHGDGQARAEFLPIMYGEELMQAFREFKRAWDPDNRMNPGKLIDPRRADQDLKFGPEYRPVTLQTRFAFKTDVGNGFTRATEHCVGMGKCRAPQGGTMCPSYRGTREERYSTRGRSRLLNEMLRGEVITGGWASAEVHEALEWCLACKGCRTDCPTHTDMAAYKAEFMSHYYESHARPASHVMGLIGEWAPLGASLSALSNALSPLAKPFLGIARERSLPAFAARTLRRQFKPAGKGVPVILFDDTFTGHFRPATGLAAQRVLERAGAAVELPAEQVCCGRPYYDFGMLDRAKRSLEKVLQVLGPRIDAGVPMVVLEPGCHSVFKDELLQLFPDDLRAARLAKQALTLGQFLLPREVQKRGKKVLLHGHCHQKSLVGTQADIAVLQKAGCEVLAPDTGCCGMAGSFGYRAPFYETSRRIAELGILPALRGAPEHAVVANGFSCREQIESLGARTTLHLAELLDG